MKNSGQTQFTSKTFIKNKLKNVKRHKIGDDIKYDELIYKESDESYFLDLT